MISLEKDKAKKLAATIASLERTRRNYISNRKKYKRTFNRDLLPSPGEYYRNQALKLIGGGEWKSAICPFHADSRPSLRLRLDSGGFRCMVCGVHGGDILSFHMQRYNLNFVDAARALKTWEVLQ